MDAKRVIILAVVQGLTEFLPVSSSGHLVVLQKIFGFSQAPVLFDILLHVGTLGAIIFYFRKGLTQFFSTKILWLILLGTVPAALVGVLFEKQIELAFDSLKAVGLAFLFTAGLLFSTKWVKNKNRQFSAQGGSASGGNQLKWLDAVFIGLFQASAILPGISRSGSTIVSGLWRGLSQETAFTFSFYLAIPAILGALVLKSSEILIYSSVELVWGLAGMMIAGVVGFFSLGILVRVLKSARFFWFGVYCFVLGIVLLLV